MEIIRDNKERKNCNKFVAFIINQEKKEAFAFLYNSIRRQVGHCLSRTMELKEAGGASSCPSYS